MDRLKRLTRWDEWRVGGTYRWLKDRQHGEPLRCAEVNRRDGFVRFEGKAGGLRCFGWKGRFVHVCCDDERKEAEHG